MAESGVFQQEMEGLQLACLYSWGCPELNSPPLTVFYPNAEGIIFDFLQNPGRGNLPLIREILEQLDPFLCYQLIGLRSGRQDFLAKDIVRSHWLSGKLLKQITKEEIETFFQQKKLLSDVPHKLTEIAIKLSGLIGGLPHHNFVVLQLVGVIKGDIPSAILEKINQCLVKTGEVIELVEEEDIVLLKVKTIVLVQERGHLFFVEEVEVLPSLEKNVKRGDKVSIHLAWIRQKLDEKEAEELNAVTAQALKF